MANFNQCQGKAIWSRHFAGFILSYPPPVYTQIQIRIHLNLFLVFWEKLVYFHRLGTGAAMLAACRRSGNRRFHYARLRLVSGQEDLFPHRFGAFSISSLPFHFVLWENNLKIMSTRPPAKWPKLLLRSGNMSLSFELPENSVPRLHKAQSETDSERTWDLHMCHRKPRTGQIPDRKTNCKTCLEIFIILFFFLRIFICRKLIFFKSFIEKGFKKAENSEQNVVLQLFLFTLDAENLSVQNTPTLYG